MRLGYEETSTGRDEIGGTDIGNVVRGIASKVVALL
jgi:hypothetical protein